MAAEAGAGKTFALGAAREAWQAAGYSVLGVAVARRAANELQAGAGIQSTSVAALLADLRHAQLPERSVLVVEAGMLATRQLVELIDHVKQVEGKLVLVGDHRQLPEIDAGGSFLGLVRRGLAVELGENVRQVNTWEREALDQLRIGGADSALARYVEHDALVAEPTDDETRERLVRDWLEAKPGIDCVMIAQRRADVADLNARARTRLLEAGAIGGDELVLSGGAFAVGDRVVVKRNHFRRGVSNGQRGQIVAIDTSAGSLALDCDGRRVQLDHSFRNGVTHDGEPTLLHGYAITGHVAQGATVDRAFVLAGEGMSREWAYVALSRGRLGNRLYVAARPDDGRAEFAPSDRNLRDPIERMAAAMRESRAQVLAIDSGSSILGERRIEADRAARERRGLERQGRTWLPRRRRRLEQARQRERAAAAALVDAERTESERRHGARPFVTEHELDARLDANRERLAECATERILRRSRAFGREL